MRDTKQIYYYAVAIDGIETTLGTTHRGYVRAYASLRTMRRYFLDGYIRGIYAECVAHSDMRDYVVNVYVAKGLDSRLAYNDYTLVYSERV